jgi:hypothetical protein
LELEKAAKHGAQRGVKIKKMWDPADGYDVGPYPSGDPHLPFQVKPLSSVFMDDLKVAHKYGGDDGA